MSVEYTYTKVCNTGRLEKDIQDSAITIALDYILNTSDISNNLHIFFKAALSANEESELDTIVANCTNEPLPQPTQPYTSDGIPIVTQQFSYTESLVAMWEGKKATFIKSSDGNVHESSDFYQITYSPFKLAGGEYWVQNPDSVHSDDYIVIDICDIDGVYYPAGTILKTLVVKDFVKKGNNSFEYHTQYCPSVHAVSALPINVYFRVRYFGYNTTEDIVLIYRLHFYR